MKAGKLLLAALALSAAGATLAQAQNVPSGGWGYGPIYGPDGPHMGYGGYGAGPMWAPWGGGGSGYGPMMPMQGWRAQQGWGMHPGVGMGPGYGRVGMPPVDLNQDGTITAEEAASHAESVFDAMDADGDDALTEAEYMAVRMGQPTDQFAFGQGRMQARKKARFEPMDTDKNGSVSKDEFMTAAQAHFEAAAKNGKPVTPWDFRRRSWN